MEAAAEEAAKNITELSLRKYFEKIDHQEPHGDAHALTSKTLQSSAEELIQLSEFCASHGRQLELSEILQILAHRIERLVPFTTCAFFIETGHGSLEASYVAGKHVELLGLLSIELGKGISGWVAAYKMPMLNAKPALEFQGIAGDFAALADALVVPITSRDNCIGTISLYSEAPATYTRAHQELLQTIAVICAPLLLDAHNQSRANQKVDHVDPITRTYSSAYLAVAGAGLIVAAEQNKAPLCLLNLEVKNLRHIANMYGNAAADSLVGKIADAFRLDLRDTDVLVRFGTQGFVAILPGVRQDQALRWAQRLEQRIRVIALGPGQRASAHCYVAVASYPQDGSDIYALIGVAQQSLAAQQKPRISATEEIPTSVVGFPPRN
jgi:diguanylate cyclase (GGDEF)-like protein